MKIKSIFEKDLFRPINGVVKADQLDESVIWQELDEFIVTRELDRHFRKFISAYLDCLDNHADPVIGGRIGVWMSGFFGSGKSHFLKIVSYLLGNQSVREPGTGIQRKPVDFFQKKLQDPMLFADIKRATEPNCDVVLFNIDSKADPTEGRGVILSVFMRVFNEMLGFCGEAPHIAELERKLLQNNKLDAFHTAFNKISGKTWCDERDAYLLMRDETIEALSAAMSMSHESASQWFDKAGDEYTLTPESFCKLVRQYLDSKGDAHRIAFLVDEMGQFIGTDGHLMLNLQTIAENLGTFCAGRAWLIVTSQEDIDAVLGEIKSKDDFSKITGRFHTRLSLSSSNTDEVIHQRLLLKKAEAENELKTLYRAKGDIIRHQLTFTSDCATLKTFKNADDFSLNYPFGPHQFQLVQTIFESIRKAGATGLHLSRGERSMLDSFQWAAKAISEREIGALVPLYEFYPAIESFLDTKVKKTVDQAADNASLKKPFDVQLLRVLFLIRYLDLIKPNVDNLVTLCVDEVDTDKITLKERIQQSLLRLEKETLINRSGDHYFFLTDEEREIGRAIKNVRIESNEEITKLAELLFEEILKSQNKFRYKVYKRDYPFNRLCDGHPYGGKVDHELTLDIMSPLSEEYDNLTTAQCIIRSTEDKGRVLVKLGNDNNLASELRTYVQTEKYITKSATSAASDSFKRILQQRADENRERRDRLIKILDDLALDGEFYVTGQFMDEKQKPSSSRQAIEGALDYLVKNAYPKLGYIKTLHDDPQKEIKAVLTGDDLVQQELITGIEKVNPDAIQDIRQYVNLLVAKSQMVAANEMVERFSKRPYGWPEWETVLLLARLFVAGELRLVMDGSTLDFKEAVGPLTKSVQWKQVSVHKRKLPAKEDLEAARTLGKDIFGKIGPDSPDSLHEFLREGLRVWGKSLASYKPLADTGKYPGKKEIDECSERIAKILAVRDPYEFFQAFNHAADGLRDTEEDMRDLTDFYKNLKPAWERLQNALSAFGPNRTVLEKEPNASKSLKRMDQILAAPRPYPMLKEVDGLIADVSAVNDVFVCERRDQANQIMEGRRSLVSKRLEESKAGDSLRNTCLKPLQDIKKQIQNETSIPNISFHLETAKEHLETAFGLIDEASEGDGLGSAEKTVVKVRPAELTPKVYLETDDDVEEYLKRLRDKLLEAIKGNSRIRIV